jgi:Ulp1 protease family, C-terminal catalytic domain
MDVTGEVGKHLKSIPLEPLPPPSSASFDDAPHTPLGKSKLSKQVFPIDSPRIVRDNLDSYDKERRLHYFSEEEKELLRQHVGASDYILIHHFLYVEDNDKDQTALLGTGMKYEGWIKLRDFRSLKPQQWLLDTVIDLYLDLQHQDCNGAIGYAPVMCTQRLMLPENNNNRATKEYNYAMYRDTWMNKSPEHQEKGIFAEKKTLFPINVGDNHWIGVVADFEKKELQYYDSLPPRDGSKELKMVWKYLEYEWVHFKVGGVDANGKPIPLNKKKWTWGITSPKEFPHQRNYVDCGVYVCCLYDWLIKGTALPLPGPEQFLRRMEIALVIIHNCIKLRENPKPKRRKKTKKANNGTQEGKARMSYCVITAEQRAHLDESLQEELNDMERKWRKRYEEDKKAGKTSNDELAEEILQRMLAAWANGKTKSKKTEGEADEDANDDECSAVVPDNDGNCICDKVNE